jgi:hypothetical protein
MESLRMWPTPRVSDVTSGRTLNEKGQRVSKSSDKVFGANLSDVVKMWPTPTAACASGGQTSRSGKRKGELLLAGAVRMFPTPTASMMTTADMEQARYAGNKGSNRPSYQDAKMWATPTASVGGPEPDGATGRKLVTQVGGQLNPTWVEWLMGWPLGWTDCAVSATDKFRQWQRSHGIS